MQKDHDLWFQTVKDRKIIEETPPQNVYGRASVKTELKHEIERSEDLNLTSFYEGGPRTKKDLFKRQKIEDQVIIMKRGLKVLGLLLLVTILLFILSLVAMNRKLATMQARVSYLESALEFNAGHGNPKI